MSGEAVRGLIKALRVLIEVAGVPKEAVRVQHSHSLYNTLTTVRSSITSQESTCRLQRL
jgi:hypothetical protein